MRFGPVPIEAAVGTVLAHALKLDGVRLKKGHLLTSADVAAALDAGVSSLIVARIEKGDVQEDAAALQVANSLTSQHFELAEAFTGRVNIFAASAGMFSANRALVDRLNKIDPAITLATLDDGVFVEQGRMVATVKIIPFAVSEQALKRAQAVCGQGCVIDLVPSKPMSLGLIATQLPALKPSIMDKTRAILEVRLASAGSVLDREIRCAHETDALSQAIVRMHQDVDMTIIFGASAITDRYDVIPAAIEQAGGSVVRFGMPVDPGNLLLVAQMHNKPIIGAPGCARSPAENGFDWILQRLLAGLPVDDTFISGLGVGGLLMEITSRPQPREG